MNIARLNALANDLERTADAIAITYQNADQRRRATGPYRRIVAEIRAAITEEAP